MIKKMCFFVLSIAFIFSIFVLCIALSVHEVKVPLHRNLNEEKYKVVKIDTLIDSSTKRPHFIFKQVWYTEK